MAKHDSKRTDPRSADRKYKAFARDNQAWHTKVEKSIEKIDRVTRTSSSGRASA